MRDNKFEDNVQIQEVEPQFKFLYHFISIKSFSRYRFEEEDDDDEDEGDINTKGDLFMDLSKQEKIDLDQSDTDFQNDPKYLKKMDSINQRRKQSKNLDDEYYQETI